MGKRGSVKSFLLRAFLPALLFTFAEPAVSAEVKVLSFAINEANSTKDKQPIRDYMGQNNVDFGVFDFAKAPSYFVNTDFTNNGINFKVVISSDYGGGNNHAYKYIIYDCDKYELVGNLDDFKSGQNIAAVFEDECGDQFALICLRDSNYNASKESATLTPVKTYIEGIATKYPNAKLIVTYNARLSSSLADVLNTYLTETSSGPQMTCLGRTSADETNVGAVYMYPSDVPASHSVSLVSNSIGTKYNGTLATLGYPPKCKVIFNDWDGTGLQTNIVFADESVTPPTVPRREGYTFTGWDHPASDFASVSESFTATAQYASNAAWLNVSGNPENFGTANPAYGTITEIAENDTFTASVAAPAVEEGAIERWVCTGYTHYKITDLATGEKTVEQEGNTASFAYTHVFHDELVWHFTNEWLVAASATAGGSVSATETWVRNGDSLRLVATPEEGYALWRWDGDTDGIADVTSVSIDVAVTSARSLRAVFAPQGADASVQYVATTGDDANDGYSAESPKLTIQAAVDTLAAKPGYGTVHVGAGPYVLQDTVMITNAITVLGATGNPEDVILHAKDVKSTEDMLALRVNHADALVANLSVENGHGYQKTSYPYGSNVAIEGNGGTVSNCVIRGGTWTGMYARGGGAWLNSDAALLTHCVVTNNNTSGSSKQISGGNIYGGLFVHIEKGVVANCLIANNRDTGGTNAVTDERQSWACGVTVRNGCILNCTVVTNEARYTGGVYLYSTGYATNVVVAGCVNRCTYYEGENPKFTDIGFKGTLANASHCASDGGEALDGTCVAGTAADFFADFNGGDYRLSKNSPLRNKGLEYDDIAEFDLMGKKRVQGRAPDIGCYEASPNAFLITVR
jgi:uncharacterized repeat protein (TIGR02543 family)